MSVDQLFEISERARSGGRLTQADKDLLAKHIPNAPREYREKLPSKLRHPAGFTISGAPVRTFTASALLVAARRAFGDRYGGKHPFYDEVEKDLAFGIMRAHFHHDHPKGAYCCGPCTLAVIPVLRAGTIRWFDCKPLLVNAERLVKEKKWRFAGAVNPRIIEWAMSDA